MILWDRRASARWLDTCRTTPHSPVGPPGFSHHHSGLSYLTPVDVHYGRAATILEVRHRTRLAAYAAHPERFVEGPPRAETLPAAVWINPPANTTRQHAPGTTIVTPDDPQPGSFAGRDRLSTVGRLLSSIAWSRYSKC